MFFLFLKIFVAKYQNIATFSLSAYLLAYVNKPMKNFDIVHCCIVNVGTYVNRWWYIKN